MVGDPTDRGVVVAKDRVLAVVDTAGDGTGSAGVDAGVVVPTAGGGAGVEPDLDGSVHPADDTAVAVSSPTTTGMARGRWCMAYLPRGQSLDL
jgi:hypothetical protein